MNKKDFSILVLAAKQGDKEAFTKIYKEYITPIYRFVYFRVNSRDEAEDLVQTVFLRAWKALPNYRDQGWPFSSWLYKIAKNLIIDYYRHCHETVISQLDENLFINDDSKKIESAEDLKRLLKKIDPEQAEILILKYSSGLSAREIGVLFEKSEEAIRQIQSRAIKLLRSKKDV